MTFQRFQKLALFASAALLWIATSPAPSAGAPASEDAIELSVSEAGPRQIEATTKTAVERDYANAWQAMSQALATGDGAMLDHYWTGVAHEKLLRLTKDERSSNLRVRYSDHSHRLQAVFYPADGAALLLHDSVEGEMEILDGSKVIDSEPFSQKYVVLMTPGQDRWFVRVFEETPSF